MNNSELEKNIVGGNADAEFDENISRRKPKPKGSLAKKVVCRFFISLGLALVLIFTLVWTLLYSVAHGPSESLRDLLVMSAMQASATKWVPYLVLPAEEVEAIIKNSNEGSTEVLDPDDLADRTITKVVMGADGVQYEIEVIIRPDGSEIIVNPDGTEQEFDEWETAIDGIQYITINRSTFRAYMLIIKDPSRVFVATSSDYKSGAAGKRFFEMAEMYNAVALINGGEFSDPGGQGNGANPGGLTFSRGECVWSDANTWKTFIGFNKENKLVVYEGLTKEEAIAAGIRDGVCFMPSKNSSSSRLIYQDEEGKVYVNSYNSAGLAQRSAIAQRADGAVIFLTTDGRTSSSPGANYNDITQLLYEYGAVSAGMLDGGSSAMLYYREYYKLYNLDYNSLGEYQKMGLVNQYVAFTTPRRIPTYFCVGKSGD